MYNDDKQNENVDGIVEDTQPNADKIESAIEDIVDTVKDMAKDAGEDAEAAFEKVKEFAEGVTSKVNEAATEMGDEFKVKYLKVLAEMENLRKRFDIDKADVLKYKASSFIINILPTVDMFEMAMKVDNASDEVKNYVIGFEMILNNFKSALEGEGVKVIETKKGDDFDAKLHHAIEEVETEEVEAGKIFEVKMKGYMIHDKLLRPATVIVAKAKDSEEIENTEEV